ncbi:MAG: DUF4350 domain-containing protein [Bifidobacteriaceae bacterium]|jgi:hypothetical protein|nr:DUF4350 domain-containing protein [Bifidobacteriaceae bacterium]
MSDPFAPVAAPVAASAKARVRSRTRSVLAWAFGLGLPLAAAAAMTAAMTVPTDETPLSAANPGPDGAMALVKVLEDHGVAVEVEERTAAAVAQAEGQVTLAIVGDARVSDRQLELYSQVSCDVVLISPDPALLDRLEGTMPAGRLAVEADGWVFANEEILEDDNAATALRTLGQNPRLIWNMARYEDEVGDQASLWGLLPPWAKLVAVQLVIAAGGAALWRGRRMGRPVPEELPVSVPASQTTVGLGRLYGRSRALGHAAAALRATSAARLAPPLGLGPSAAPATLVAAIAEAAGRSPSEVSELLYGPPPSGGGQLVALAKALDELEKDVESP